MTRASRQVRLSSMAGLSFGLSRQAGLLAAEVPGKRAAGRATIVPTGALEQAGALRSIGRSQPAAEPAGCWAEAALAGSRDVVLVLAPDCSIRIANASASRTFGLPAEALVGLPLIELVHPGDAELALAWLARVIDLGQPISHELRCRLADGGWIDVEATANPMLAVPAVHGIVLTLRDISERKALEAELNHWAYHDPLTNLANRTQLRERISNALDRSARSEAQLALLLIDLDDFKQINDSLGHREGDRLLVAIAERLRDCVENQDTLARLSGDEFAVLIPDLADDQHADRLAGRIARVLNRPITLQGEPISVTASIGIRVTAGDVFGCDTEQIIRDADLAMYAAKAGGKGSWQRFRPEMHELARRQLTIRTELRQAVQRREFALRYQPIVDLASRRLVGFEALVRWRHPERGLISPDQFIAEAEVAGTVIAIGAQVLQAACLAAAELRRLADQNVVMSVNVSPRQLMSDDILDVVTGALATSGLPASALCLEITESVLAEDAGVVDRLASLRALGVHLAIDDFGTGFAGYAHLQRLPIDTVKIDRSFIEPLQSAGSSSALVGSIITMCQSLGLRTVAEGVETDEQFEQLRLLGCQSAQGYLFDRPLDYPDAVDALLGCYHGPPAEAPEVSG